MRASGTFHGQPVPDAEAPFPGRMSPFGSTARQCSRLSRARGAFHRRRPARAPFREPVRRAVPAGRRGQPLRFFIEVRKPRLDLCSLAVAGAFKAERASTVSASGCFREHDNGPLERPDHRKVMGRLPESERKSPFDRGNRRSYAGSGVENTESRHSPRGIAPGGDFAPTPDRFEHLVSRTSPASLPGETREESDAADAAHTCIARAARGSCDARFPRRNPTLTNPRGLPSSGRSRCEREAPL